jgi:hypothetical protein
VWGANHNWREVQHKRLRAKARTRCRITGRTCMWVFGAKDMDDFLAKSA